jgi:hypothetical protein
MLRDHANRFGCSPGIRLIRLPQRKIDYALSVPIPWTAPECSRAATVHIGGLLEEIAESERTFTSDRPFVLNLYLCGTSRRLLSSCWKEISLLA